MRRKEKVATVRDVAERCGGGAVAPGVVGDVGDPSLEGRGLGLDPDGLGAAEAYPELTPTLSFGPLLQWPVKEQAK